VRVTGKEWRELKKKISKKKKNEIKNSTRV
jgi:hypothetical protein